MLAIMPWIWTLMLFFVQTIEDLNFNLRSKIHSIINFCLDREFTDLSRTKTIPIRNLTHLMRVKYSEPSEFVKVDLLQSVLFAIHDITVCRVKAKFDRFYTVKKVDNLLNDPTECTF